MGSKEKQPSPLKRARHAAEYAAVAAFAGFLRLMPRRAALALGRGVGSIAYALLPHDRQVAFANLNIVVGNSIPLAAKRRIVRRTFQRFAATVFGLLWAPRLTRRALDGLLDAEDTLAVLRDLEARRKGVVLVTAHYGDWELLCSAAGLLGFPLLVVTEPMPNRLIERLIDRCRTATGNRTVPPRFALLKLFRGLRQGQRVTMMADVNGRRGRGGVWLDFFGLRVFNGTALAELALRTGAAVLFVAAKPLPGGRTRLVCRPPIEFARTGDHAADVQALSQQVLDCCRDLIREDPEPWLWTYKRWKRRPTPQAPGYPFYSKYARTE